MPHDVSSGKPSEFPRVLRIYRTSSSGFHLGYRFFLPVSAALSSSFDTTLRGKAKAAEFFHPVIETSQMRYKYVEYRQHRFFILEAMLIDEVFLSFEYDKVLPNVNIIELLFPSFRRSKNKYIFCLL